MKDKSYELIDTSKNMKYVIGWIEKKIDSEKYNKRMDWPGSTTYFFKSLNKEDYDRFHRTNNTDIQYDVYLKYNILSKKSWAFLLLIKKV